MRFCKIVINIIYR